MGAQQSRLAKAGGDPQAAAQMLANEFASGAKGWSAAEKADYSNPATRDAWIARKIGQATKGKFSGPVGGLVKTIGKAAPLAALIPGVGPLAAGAIGAAGGLVSGGGFKGALTGGALGAGGAALLGGEGYKGIGDVGHNISDIAGDVGHAISRPGMLGNAAGGLDLGKVIGAAGGISSIVGQGQQRKSNQNYINTQTDMRNKLLERILERPNYGLPQVTPAANSSTGY